MIKYIVFPLFLILIAATITGCLMGEEENNGNKLPKKVLLSDLKGYYAIEDCTKFGVWFLTIDKDHVQRLLPKQSNFILETEDAAYPLKHHKICDDWLFLLLPEGVEKSDIEKAEIKTTHQSGRNIFSSQNRKIEAVIIQKKPAENGTSFFKLPLSDYLQLKADNSSFIYDSLKLIRPAYLITDEGSCYAMKTYLNARQACDTHDVDGAISFLKGRDNPESYMYFGNPNRISVKQGGGINKSPPDDRTRLRNLGTCGNLNEDHLYNIETDQPNNCFRITINREKLPSEYSSEIVFSTFMMEATECLFNATNDISILEATLSLDTSCSTEMIKNARFDGFTFALYDSDSTKKGHYSTLSDAVEAAVDDDRISVGSSETILETQQIVVQDKAITIQSVNDNPFTLDYSGSATRSLLITENASLSLKNVIIQNCHNDENGAAIMNAGILYLNSATLTNNITSKDGGGIYNGGECVVMNSEISHNQAARGGGIYVHHVSPISPRTSGLTIIEQNLIKNNTANDGGGVYVEANQSPLIVENTFESNTASLKGGGIYVAEGGTVQNTNGVKWQAHQLPGTTDDVKAIEGVDNTNIYTLNSISGNTTADNSQLYYARTDTSHLTKWIAHDKLNCIRLYGTFSAGDIMRLFDSSSSLTEIASTLYSSGDYMNINRDVTSSGDYYVTLQDESTEIYAQSAKRKAAIVNTPTNAPTLLSPVNNAVELIKPVILKWNETSGDDTYKVYYGTNQNALDNIKSCQETEYTLNSLNTNTTYYWKVEAVDQYGATLSSTTRNFKTLPFEGGRGTSTLPYQVKTAAQLNAVRDYPSCCFKQIANINLSAYSNWDPIDLFTGVYDGQDHIISNLNINSNADNLGLFGGASKATLNNINVTNISIKGTSAYPHNCGGLVGMATATTIVNCHTSGTINAFDYDNIGGLVGYFYGFTENTGSISLSHSDCTIIARYYVGGLVGRFGGKVSIDRCFATGNVTACGDVGGLIGISESARKVENAYARGDVKGTNSGHIGGLIGRINDGDGFSDCYSTGKITSASSNYTGGLVGRYYGAGISGCYWDKGTSGMDTSAAGIGRTTSDMKIQSKFPGWDFTDVWNIDSKNDGYPYLRDNLP